MKHLPLFLLLALLLTGRTAVYSAAPAVTWAAQGLPPGLSINASTGAISGNPTTAGNYTVLIYPKIGGVAGNMNTIKITVLPAGVNLPVYYGYQRLSSDGNYLNTTVGGGGYIWGNNGALNSPIVSSNGITFNAPSLPPSVTQESPWGTLIAVCGNKALYLGADDSGSQHLLLSTRGGAFYDVSVPGGVIVSLGSDGVNFYAITADGGVWKSASSSIAWAPIANTTAQFYDSLNFTCAKNANTTVLAYQLPYYTSDQPKGLIISTDGGVSYFLDTSNSQITSVAYGNGKFLGTGSYGTGVWSSSDGQNWTQISLQDPGAIMYSSSERLFFSAHGGVSSDGLYWQPYMNIINIGYDVLPASSGSGIVYLGGQQLSTNNIPNSASGTFQTSVGKKTTITATH